MSMNPSPRTMSDEDQDLVAKYLREGGIVTVGEPGETTTDFASGSSWGHQRKKQKPEEDAK